MSILPVHVTHNSASGTSCTITSTTAGNCIVVVVTGNGSGGVLNITGVTLGGSADNFGGSAAVSVTRSNSQTSIWVDSGCAGAKTSVAVSGSNLPANLSIFVYEFSGLDPVSPVAATNSANGATTAPSSGSVTAPGEAAYVGIFGTTGGSSASSQPAAPWTNANQMPTYSAYSGYEVLGSGSTETYAGTYFSASGWTAAIVALNPAAPLPADVSATETGTATAAANVSSPADVSKTTTASATVTANVSSPAGVTSTTTATSTATVPVPAVTATTTASATAAVTVSSPAAVAATATATATVTANAAHAADVTRTTTASATVTASVPTNVAATVTATASVTASVHFVANVASTTTALTRLRHTRGGARVATFYGPLVIGRLTLTESPESSGSADSGRSLSVEGQEASPALSASQVAAWERAEGLLAYRGAVVPCQWSDKPHLNGWYQVDSPSADEETWGDLTTIRWKCNLVRVGADSEVEIESRLIGGNRLHASAATAELWHAASIGNDSYLVGNSTPGSVVRSGSDGAVIVYQALPADENPRWSVPTTSYLAGASQVIVDGYLRMGLTCADTPSSWSLDNSLIKVEPRTSAGTLRVSSWLTSSWGTAKVFDLKRGSTSLGAAQHVTVLRNDPCEVVIRLTWDHSPGRTIADLSLKRGARHVGIYLRQYAVASSLRVDDNGAGGTVSNQLTAAGYIASTTSDGDGNRWVLGTTVASAAAGTFGFAASSPAAGMPLYIGCVYGGASPTSGDAAADVNAQFLGSPSETERLIQR